MTNQPTDSLGAEIEIERRRCPVLGCTRPQDAADAAVRRVFNILGVNVDNPHEVEKFRQGLRYGEDLLDYSKKGKIAVMTAFIGLMTAAIWSVFFKQP